MVRFTLFATALCLGVIVCPAISDAQINPFRSSRSGLRGDDFTLMTAAASKLYQQDVVSDGAADNWSNPQTGNSGTVTVLQSFQKDGMTCRKVRYVIHLRASIEQPTYTVNWCKTASGEWKMA
jgi:surface antigen